MQPTGKTIVVEYNEKKLTINNQKSKLWSHAYSYGKDNSTLSDAGCGLFAIAHVSNFLTGQDVSVEALADFACENGARDDTGTDRPTLLSALVRSGQAWQMGFDYHHDGLRNDHNSLKAHLHAGGLALCNIRVGHIVLLCDIREIDGEAQVLVIDSYSESGDHRIIQNVCAVIEQSVIDAPVYSKSKALAGYTRHYAMYWVPLSMARDFNLIYRL